MGASKNRTWIPAALLFGVVASGLLIAPPVIRGLAAHEWLIHYSGMETLPQPRKATARAIAAKTDVAIQNLAPLPQASAAALLALKLGQRAQFGDHDQEAARLIYEGVRESCARVRTRFLSGPGFAVIEARASALTASLGSEPKP